MHACGFRNFCHGTRTHNNVTMPAYWIDLHPRSLSRAERIATCRNLRSGKLIIASSYLITRVKDVLFRHLDIKSGFSWAHNQNRPADFPKTRIICVFFYRYLLLWTKLSNLHPFSLCKPQNILWKFMLH